MTNSGWILKFLSREGNKQNVWSSNTNQYRIGIQMYWIIFNPGSFLLFFVFLFFVLIVGIKSQIMYLIVFYKDST